MFSIANVVKLNKYLIRPKLHKNMYKHDDLAFEANDLSYARFHTKCHMSQMFVTAVNTMTFRFEWLKYAQYEISIHMCTVMQKVNVG